MATGTYGTTATSGITSGKGYQTPENFSGEVVTVLNHMKRLLSASTMQEHFDATNILEENVVWDGPLIYTEDKDKLRVLEYFGKLFATAQLDPQMVSLGTSRRGDVMLESYTNFLLMPRRSLLLWWNYLLPRVFKLALDLDMEMGGKDKISRVRTRFHNWPTLPAFVRQLGTWMVAQPLLWTEPIWSQLVHFIGDNTYQREWERSHAYGAGMMKEGYETGYGGYGGYGAGRSAYSGATTGSTGAGYGSAIGTTGTGAGYTTGTTGTTGTTATSGYTQ